jgi:hypothetical protein
VRECGIYLSDGNLLAVWSDPNTPLAYKTAGVPIVTAFDLTMEALPAGAVTVEAGDIDLTLFFGSEFAVLATAWVSTENRLFAERERIDALERNTRSDAIIAEVRRLTSDVNSLRAPR